jgi:TolB-like protein/DNA-binding winged helix-turn-helix (wHTH) protein
MQPIVQRRIARFGAFEADLDRRHLTKSGYRIRLQDQPFQVLTMLLERPGVVVTREDLKERLWAGDTFVEFDVGLNTAIKKLRAALSDSADNPRFVETVSRVGYRFVAPVSAPEVAVTPAVGVAPPPVNVLSEPIATSAVDKSVALQSAFRNVEAEAAPFARHRFWIVPGIVLTLLLVGFATWTRVKARNQALQLSSVQAIAVLPLQNLSNDAAQEYIADGMTDEITTDLAKLAGPKVISRTSAMQYKGTHKSIPEIAGELNVGTVVEGSVERSGERIRVRIQLIQASTDHHLWAETYTRQLSDVLLLESDVAQDIARQIQLRLTLQQQRELASRQPLNPQAFQDYLQGREYWTMRTSESLSKAIEYFERAILEDPGNARSYAGLAQCYIVLPMITQAGQAETERKARESAAKALSLDESLAEAHLAIAEVEFYQDWNFPGAEKEFRRTLELNPNYATGHQWYAEFLSIFGRHEEAILEIQTALALDPLSAIVHHQAGQSFQQARQYDRAIQEYQQALKLNASVYVSQEALYWAYRRQGKFGAAIQAMQGAAPYWRPDQGMRVVIDQLSSAYAQGGKEGFLRQSVKMHEHFRDASLYLARDYVDLGDKKRALLQLEQAFKTRNGLRLWILTDPEFDSLRSDPRFQSLIQKIELSKP